MVIESVTENVSVKAPLEAVIRLMLEKYDIVFTTLEDPSGCVIKDLACSHSEGLFSLFLFMEECTITIMMSHQSTLKPLIFATFSIAMLSIGEICDELFRFIIDNELDVKYDVNWLYFLPSCKTGKKPRPLYSKGC